MLLALLVSLGAGLATSVGGAIALHPRGLRRGWLAVALAFAAGAMLFISFAQAIPLGVEAFGEAVDAPLATGLTYLAFFLGIGLVLLIDRVLPGELNPSETEGRENEVASPDARRATRRLLRSGMLVALVLGLHNLPEGMATFVATYSDPTVGLTLAVAIAIHNVPEGIAVAAPIYAATGSRRKAFWWATASGLAEPVGALLAAALVAWVVPPAFVGLLYGLVAGMMVFLAVDELLPGARRYQTSPHQSVYGVIGGMGAVALSIVLFAL